MAEHARAVIIGGGVGGTSIAYHLTELGWTDVVLRRPRRADLGLDLPFGRSRRAAAQHRDADQDDDVRLRPVPATGGRDRDGPVVARGRLAPPRVQPGTFRGAPPPGRLGQDVRPAARAHHRRRGAGTLPAHVDRGRPRRGLPADRWLARPVRSCQRPGRRRAPARRADPPAHARGGDRRRSAAA